MHNLMGWPMFMLVAILAQLWNIQQEYRIDPEGYLYGDAGLYAAAAHSMLHDGDLDLLNQCFPGRESVAAALPEMEGAHGREFAVSKNDSITLKQSPVLPVLALPFYALMGKVGLLVFNLVMLNLMLILMAILGGDSWASRLVVLIGFVTTPLWKYAFNFSPDIFLCVLILGAIWAAQQRRPTVSGLLAGLAVSTKIYVAVILLPLPLIVWAMSETHFLKAFGKHVLGGIIGMVPSAIFNVWQFGSPLVNGYGRQMEVHDGVIGLSDHISMFNVPMLQGMHNIFLDETLGLLPTAPLWFLWPIAFVLLVLYPSPSPLSPLGREGRKNMKVEVIAIALMIVATLALFIPFAGWAGTRVGNRYLFPAVTLGIVVMARFTHLRIGSTLRNVRA